MDTTTTMNTNTPETTNTYGNLEITIQGMTKIQLDSLLELITERVESIGLTMVATAYMTTDDDYEPDSYFS